MNSFFNVLKGMPKGSLVTMKKVLMAIIKDREIVDALAESGTDTDSLLDELEKQINEEDKFFKKATDTIEGLLKSNTDAVAMTPDVSHLMQSVYDNSSLCHCSAEEFTSVDAFALLYNISKFNNSDMFGIAELIEDAGGDWDETMGSLTRLAFPGSLHIPILDGNKPLTSVNGDNAVDLSMFPFLTDMIEQAKTYSLPFIGREDIINRTIMILNRKTKHNVIHLGEPGVGKTACTIGLSKRILDGNVPDVLKGAKVYSLDMGALMAGTKYRGEMEDKISGMLNALKRVDGNVILYIDEFHLVVGAGATSGSSIDVANLLKPYLASADTNIRVIGATTKEEYRKYVEKDKALARRFQTIDILEPSVEDATEILMGLKSAFEEYHKIKYTKDAMRTAVELSAKYINDRFLPDKAIDVIDETASRLSIAGIKSVKKEDIQDTVAQIAKIPSDNMKETETDRLSRLSDTIKKNVFGQDEAADEITAAVQMSKAGLTEANKPIASFLFVGPTGVGKTEIAKTLASSLDLPLVRFDMSEYKDKTSVNKLIGASAGYVGYENGGLLVNTIKDKPSCVLLLDEIEKAHPDVFDTLLQVMDNAVLTDNQGRVADFKNTIIIMTSNAGARDISKSSIGFGHQINAVNISAMDDAVKDTFAPEFINRLSAIVKFNSMNKDMAYLIASKQLKILAEMLKAKKVKLSYTKNVIPEIISDCETSLYGGREIVRRVDKEIKPLFVSELLFGSLSKGGSVKLDVADGKFVISTATKAPKPHSSAAELTLA